MQCFSPITLETQGPATSRFQDVPCGVCAGCLTNKRNQMSFRAFHELKDHQYQAIFITLTYDDYNCPTLLDKTDVQKFIKRLRKKTRCRYLICGEYGEITYRPHYHGIIYGLSNTLENALLIQNTWKQGFTSIGSATCASIHYITKYIMKPYKHIIETDTDSRAFYLLSKNPIFGYKYIKDYQEYHNNNKNITTAYYNGYAVTLPYNFKNKLNIKSEVKLKEHRPQENLEHYAYQEKFNKLNHCSIKQKEITTNSTIKIPNNENFQ
jgi:hypothetical protein